MPVDEEMPTAAAEDDPAHASLLAQMAALTTQHQQWQTGYQTTMLEQQQAWQADFERRVEAQQLAWQANFETSYAARMDAQQARLDGLYQRQEHFFSHFPYPPEHGPDGPPGPSH